MRILVTGGTGFIGAHSVAALLRAGHEVRMLVRNPVAVAPALRPLGVDATEVGTSAGDVTDRDAVRRAVAGCDSVLHAAGVYSFDSRDVAAMRRVNAPGTEVVLGTARAAGLDPIVHVSTFGALLPGPDAGSGAPLSTAAAIGTARDAYLRTKADAERIARRHQADGAPVVITYPPAVLGPYDDRLGDQVTRLRNALRGLMPMWPSGGFPIGDVRDTAALHAGLMRPGLGARRYFGPGRYVSTRDYVRTLREVTGRTLPTVFLPARAMLPIGALVGVLQRAVPVHLPAEHGAVYLCATARPYDAAATDALLGTGARPLYVTLADTVAWLHATGRLGRRLSGRAARISETV
ncbi:NAD-dependent epimerase/dehydratase family protein [Dactylosporangium sp. NPDC049140]|uniref:NAD-dependent epimerase/dehydratase family protein n=1 Tax=Dactylosporangium sp. NPDC049140 TaxID=3155647 RepID=UPI0033CA7F5A